MLGFCVFANATKMYLFSFKFIFKMTDEEKKTHKIQLNFLFKKIYNVFKTFGSRLFAKKKPDFFCIAQSMGKQYS